MGRREVKDSCVCGGNSVSRMEMLGAVTLTGVPEGHWPYGERWDKGLGENEGKPATGAKMGRKGSENKQSKTQRHMVVKVKVREGEVRLQRSGARMCITEGAEAILPRCLAAVGGGVRQDERPGPHAQVWQAQGGSVRSVVGGEGPLPGTGVRDGGRSKGEVGPREAALGPGTLTTDPRLGAVGLETSGGRGRG